MMVAVAVNPDASQSRLELELSTYPMSPIMLPVIVVTVTVLMFFIDFPVFTVTWIFLALFVMKPFTGTKFSCNVSPLR
jgi:hypothetical protein